MSYICNDPNITVTAFPDGGARVDLMHENESASRCWIGSHPISVGCSRVDMAGIGGVGTEEKYRFMGYSRRVLVESVNYLKQSNFGLTMLYGIPNYYHKFGFAAAGAHRGVTVEPKETADPLPSGWTMRSFQAGDSESLQRLYEQYLELNVCGAHIKPIGSDAWAVVERICTGEHDDESVVVIAPDGHIAGYARHGRGTCHHDWYEQFVPETFVVSEIVAENAKAADVLLVACEHWMVEVAAKLNRVFKHIEYSVTDEGPVAAALMRTDCSFFQLYEESGGSMVQAANIDQLFENMMPEWRRLVSRSVVSAAKVITFKVDGITKSLNIRPGSVAFCTAPNNAASVELTSGQMGQLVLGSVPAKDLLARLSMPPTTDIVSACQLLFPQRQQHMFLTDRY